MTIVERIAGALIGSNNARVRRHALDRNDPNPRPLADVAWNARLEAAHPAIRAEWDAHAAAHAAMPPIEAVVDEHQGNEGTWRVGLLITRRRASTDLAHHFPRTVEHLLQVPGMWSALFSVFDPGTELPQHQGPNAGIVRYHLGVDCGEDSALEVDGTIVPYRDGVGVLFDDTAPHAAWNRGSTPRVTILCELIRPATWPTHTANGAFQRLLAHDARYRNAPARADALQQARG